MVIKLSIDQLREENGHVSRNATRGLSKMGTRLFFLYHRGRT